MKKEVGKAKKEIDKVKEEREKIKSGFHEFKAFITRGNVIDMAVGVIIGGAFGKIVSSLVDDVLMPLIGLLLGGLDFSSLSIQIKDATIQYGMFIQNVVDFIIIAGSVFIFIKLIAKFQHKKEEPPKPPVKPRDVELLEEIRDLLAKKK